MTLVADSTPIVPWFNQGITKKFNRHIKRLNQVFSEVITGGLLTAEVMTGFRAAEPKRNRTRHIHPSGKVMLTKEGVCLRIIFKRAFSRPEGRLSCSDRCWYPGLRLIL
jgi:hypothetical protein